jgi:ERF superfamily
VTEPTIYAALAAVMADVDHVAKRDRNTAQNFNFRGIDAVVNAVGPALRKHKVIVVPRVIHADYSLVQTTTGKPSTACRVRVAYVFIGPAGDSIETTVLGEAWDSGDKATPKAMSVAYRTALLQSLSLPTDEPDPDSQTYERAPQESLNALKRRVWEQSKVLAPDLTDDDRKAYIQNQLAVYGAQSDADGFAVLLREWAA